MLHAVSNKMIEHIAVLAELELSEQEKEQAKKDMSGMLDYVEILQKVDVGTEVPISQILPIENVFRSDEVRNTDERESILANAPQRTGDSYIVPKTFYK